MLSRISSIVALFFLMLITGVFWGTWFTLTRSIDSFSAGEFIHIGQVIIANVATPMKIIMPAGILFTFIALWFANDKRTASFIVGSLSLVLIIAVLLVTLLVLVPIDNDIKTWTVATIPANWTVVRNKWELFTYSKDFLITAELRLLFIFCCNNTR